MADVEDWRKRWRDKETPWDLKGVTPALIALVKRGPVAGLDVLVPGCGRGHDAHFMGRRGAEVVAVDIAPEALETARRIYPASPVSWQCRDVTTMDYQARFDLVWEYTCFCALEPGMRDAYLDRVAAALKPGGRYIGLVFAKVPNPEAGPPFQIEPEAFHALLSARFTVDAFEPYTERSVKPRRDSEIWFEAHG